MADLHDALVAGFTAILDEHACGLAAADPSDVLFDVREATLDMLVRAEGNPDAFLVAHRKRRPPASPSRPSPSAPEPPALPDPAAIYAARARRHGGSR